MNFSSFFSYNNCMNQKFYYLLILNGIIILILGIYVFYRRENKIIKEEIDYSDNINQSVKLNDLYNEKVKKINIDFEMKDEEEINEDNILGRIIIEKINLDYFIFNEYTNKNLKVLPCRLYLVPIFAIESFVKIISYRISCKLLLISIRLFVILMGKGPLYTDK